MGGLKVKKKKLTFMGPCIVIIFLYISDKMQRYTVHKQITNRQEHQTRTDGIHILRNNTNSTIANQREE
jgi:hypothetical protein